MNSNSELLTDMHMNDDDISALLDLVTIDHLNDVADLLLGFLVTMPDATPVREPISA